MNFAKKLPLYGLLLVVLALLVPFTPAQTQSQNSDLPVAPVQNVGTKSDASTESEADEMEQLKAQVKQLQLLLEQQQRAIAEVHKRLDEKDGKASVASNVVSAEPSGSIRVVPKPQDTLSEKNLASRNVPAGPQSQSQEKPGLAGWDMNHAFIRSADGSFETSIGGYGQLDFRGYKSGDHPPNTFLIRRARLAVEGKVARYFDYKLEGDFADIAGSLLRDLRKHPPH